MRGSVAEDHQLAPCDGCGFEDLVLDFEGDLVVEVCV